jgi:hypothetical protein
MKLSVTLAAALILASAGQAVAQSPDSRQLPEPVIVSDSVVAPVAPTYSRRTRRNYSSSQDSLFGRMMELERRKNAWLRRTFLGR